MPTQPCPKCKSLCEVGERHLELGLPLECACGCKFDVFPRRLEFGEPAGAPGRHFKFAGATVSHNDSEPPSRAPGGPPYPLLFVVGGLTAAGLIWNSLWLGALFLISLSLSIFCLRRKGEWKAYNDKSPWYFFYDRSVDFLVPLTAVTLFYLALSLLVSGTTDRTTLGRLEALEGFFDYLKSALSHVVFKPWVAALIIAALITFDLLVTFYLRPSSVASRYKEYNRWSKRVYVVVVLLCSFTFFGNQVGEQSARLRLRVDKVKSGYANVREEAEDALRASVQQQLYDKVRSSLPPEVVEALDHPANMDGAVSSLRQNYAEVRKYGVSHPRVEETLARHEGRVRQAAEYAEKPVMYDEPKGVEARPRGAEVAPGETEAAGRGKPKQPPPKTSGESLKTALSELKTKNPWRARLVSLLKMEGGKQLLCQFPKSFTSVVKSAAFKATVGDYPLLEPVVDVFVGTYDKHVEEKVRASADRVADALLENPAKANEVLAAETKKISDSVNVKAPETTLEKLRGLAARIKNDLGAVRAETRKVASSLAHRREQEAARAKAEEAREARRQRAEEEVVGRRPAESPSDVGPCYCVNLRTGARTYLGIRTRAQCTGLC